MSKEIEGKITSSELGTVSGYSYGTINVLTSRGRMSIRITRDTIGPIPSDGSFVQIHYEGEHTPIASRIESLDAISASKLQRRTQIESLVKPVLSSTGSVRWPRACASCGTQESLIKYSYTHTSTKGYCAGAMRGTVTTSLPVSAYLCQNCKSACDETGRGSQYIAIFVVILGFVIGTILPIIPGIQLFPPDFTQQIITLPTIQVILLYIIIVGMPTMYCYMVAQKATYPFLDYIGIHSVGVMHNPPQKYKFVLKSPEYKEQFAHLNGFENITRDGGFTGMKFDCEILCGGICCVGVLFPIILAFIYHLVIG